MEEFCSKVRANVTRKPETKNEKSKSSTNDNSKVSANENTQKISNDGKKKGSKITSDEDFFMLSDALSEDRELRIHLQMQKLEEVLAFQEKERNQSDYKRSCLFCRTVLEGKPGKRMGMFIRIFYSFSAILSTFKYLKAT